MGPQGTAGVDGTVAFENLTEAQIESLKGPQGDVGPQGPVGETGPQGPQGIQGYAGYTPVRGVDYYTTADKNAIIADVIATLPVAEEVEY